MSADDDMVKMVGFYELLASVVSGSSKKLIIDGTFGQEKQGEGQ